MVPRARATVLLLEDTKARDTEENGSTLRSIEGIYMPHATALPVTHATSSHRDRLLFAQQAQLIGQELPAPRQNVRVRIEEDHGGQRARDVQEKVDFQHSKGPRVVTAIRERPLLPVRRLNPFALPMRQPALESSWSKTPGRLLHHDVNVTSIRFIHVSKHGCDHESRRRFANRIDEIGWERRRYRLHGRTAPCDQLLHRA